MVLNIEEMKQISFTGIRRAYAFMGLGINAANNESFIDYNLSNITKYVFLPTNFPIDEITKMKKEFKDWIISNGFQEFLCSFEVFLDNIHFVYLNVLTSKKMTTQQEAAEQHKSFKMKVVIKKLTTLQNKLSFHSKFFDHIKTINIVRNCLVHRRGIVEKKDLNDDSFLRLSWTGMEAYIQKSDNSKIFLFPPNKCSSEEKKAEKGEQIKIHFIENVKRFSLRESIKLNEIEISEILMMMSDATNEIIKQVIKYLNVNDIKIQKT